MLIISDCSAVLITFKNIMEFALAIADSQTLGSRINRRHLEKLENVFVGCCLDFFPLNLVLI